MSTWSALAARLAIACLLVLLHEGRASHQQMHKSNYKQQFREYDDNDDPGEDFSQLAETLAVSAATAAKAPNPACVPITISSCTSMMYNYTRPGNFFGDQTQMEAAERAKHYESLVRSQCSRHLLAYLCELLVPVCVENVNFEIFPCRPFCRKVKNDCDSEIRAFALNYKLDRLSAFDCETLPYEKNGDQGPCHELPGVPLRMPAPNNYKPYDQRFANVPPFITDDSPLDTQLVRPRPSPVETGTLENQSSTGSETLSTRIQSLAQQLAIGLSNYSNLLCVLTLICLVLVINAKRLRRIKNHLNRRSSSSSGSSGNSQRKLAAIPAHKFPSALSPSSSSHSLVLVATDGKRGQPKHKLIRADDYKHHYDYIHTAAWPGHQHQQQQQQCAVANYSTHRPGHYNNILLSSPSHQVLLFGDNNGQSEAGQMPGNQFVQSPRRGGVPMRNL